MLFRGTQFSSPPESNDYSVTKSVILFMCMYVSVIYLFTCDLYSVLDMQTQVSVYNYNIYTKFTCNYNIYLKTYINVCDFCL